MQLTEKVSYAKEVGWIEYFTPRNVTEALDILDEFKGTARIIAGGTDLVPASRKGRMNIKAVVDISNIIELNFIHQEGNIIKIGSLVTHAQVANSSLIKEKGTALAEGASRVGSPQVRNIGTVVGNIVNAQPGGDTIIPLLALDGSVTVKSKETEKVIALSELFTGVGKTTIDSTREIVTTISFPAQGKGEASAAMRLAKRKSLVLPILTVAVKIGIDNLKNKFVNATIAAGPVSTVPYRCLSAEKLLIGNEISDDIIKKAALKFADEARPRTSLLRGSSEYRKAMVAVMVERAIKLALQRLEVSNA